jgi:hypothetical protein
MKKESRRKMLILALLILGSCVGAECQSVSLSPGRTLMPGLYAGLRYSHPGSLQVNLAGELFMEQAQFSKLSYRATGVNILAEYSNATDPQEAKVGYKAAIGVTGQVEEEPWVYKYQEFRQRVNYGAVGELSALWNMTEAFSAAVFIQQKLLFNKLLGTTHFLFGLSISHRLGL